MSSTRHKGKGRMSFMQRLFSRSATASPPPDSESAANLSPALNSTPEHVLEATGHRSLQADPSTSTLSLPSTLPKPLSVRSLTPPPVPTPTPPPVLPPTPPLNSNDRHRDQHATSGGFFHNAHDLVLNNTTFVDVPTESVLAILNRRRVAGVEVDSSARDPPPRCYPETRKELFQTLYGWLDDAQRRWCFIWLSGPAGVGKTAVAQTFAEYCIIAGRFGAAFFFSQNQQLHELDGIVCTIAYQLAVQHKQYKEIVAMVVHQDPSIIDKNLHIQFRKLIIEPFSGLVHNNTQQPLVIIIDGLDQCRNERVKRELVKLIDEFIRSVPLPSPLLWLVTSRSEWHMEAILRGINPINYRSERLTGDVEDVCHILGVSLREISDRYGLGSWPTSSQIQKLSEHIGGLPIVASNILEFIENGPGSPDSLLNDCMRFFESDPNVVNPLQSLDTFYQEIMDRVPSPILPLTRLILAFSVLLPSLPWKDELGDSFDIAKFFGIDRNGFDLALRNLYSVIDITPCESTPQRPPEFFSKSFSDFLLDPKRSTHFSLNINHARRECETLFSRWSSGAERRDWRRGMIKGLTREQYDLYDQIMTSSTKRKLLAELRGAEAQTMVDFLGRLLDDNVDFALSQRQKKNTLHLLSKLAKDAQVFPESLKIEGVQCSLARPIAQGGYGDIYKGEHEGRLICVKAVRMFQSEEDTKRNLKVHAGELIIWAHLSHPNILPFCGIYLSGNELAQRICLVSPWMENGDLLQFLQQFPDESRIPLLYDIIIGLHYLHEFDIVHADLKAKNVIVSGTRRAMLADFGISRFSITSNTTATKPSLGTARWSAPERLLESAAIPKKEGDIWAFGCTCYEVLTGLEPFNQFKNDLQLLGAFFQKSASCQKPEAPATGIWDEPNNSVWSAAERCWNYDQTKRPKADKLLSLFTALNAQDDRPRDPEIQKARWSSASVDFDNALSILHRVQRYEEGRESAMVENSAKENTQSL